MKKCILFCSAVFFCHLNAFSVNLCPNSDPKLLQSILPKEKESPVLDSTQRFNLAVNTRGKCTLSEAFYLTDKRDPEYNKAIQKWNELFTAGYFKPHMAFSIGWIYFQNNKYDLAIEWMNETLSYQNEYELGFYKAYELLGDIHTKKNNNAEALRSYEKGIGLLIIRHSLQKAVLLRKVALSLHHLGRHEESVVKYREAYDSLENSNADSSQFSGLLAELKKLGDEEALERNFNKTAQQTEENNKRNDEIVRIHKLANAAHANEKYEEAYELAQKALDLTQPDQLNFIDPLYHTRAASAYSVAVSLYNLSIKKSVSVEKIQSLHAQALEWIDKSEVEINKLSDTPHNNQIRNEYNHNFEGLRDSIAK